VSVANVPLCCEAESVFELELVASVDGVLEPVLLLAIEPLAAPVAPNEPEAVEVDGSWLVVSLATVEPVSLLVGEVEAVELLASGCEDVASDE
jgi:hypothetical protein